jgi:hypothetical protein
MGVLTIYLDKCTDIADTDVGTEGDPYVTFELEKDNLVRRFYAIFVSFLLCRCCI